MSGTARALFMDDSDEENMGAGSWSCTLCSPGHNQVSNHLSRCPQCGTARHTAGGWDANELVPLSRMPSISVDSDLHRLPLMDIQNRPVAHESMREPVTSTRAPNSKDLSTVLVWMGVDYGVIQGESTFVGPRDSDAWKPTNRFELPRRVRKVYSGPRLYEALQLQSSAGPST